jgi:hypothetical protein
MNPKLLSTVRSQAATTAALAARAVSAVMVVATTLVLVTIPAFADPVTVTPSSSGMGNLGPKIQNLLNMTAQGSLWASLGAVILGGGMWGLSKHFGNYGGAHKGMQLVIGGGVGGLVVASAATIVNAAFGA